MGTITKAIGYKGELNLFLDTDEPDAYKNLESIFIEQNGLLVPFFLEKAQIHRNQHLRILIEDFPEPERLIGRNVFLPLSTLPKLGADKFYYHEIIGFTAKDTTDKSIGKIKEVRDTSAQELLVIETPESKEILVPLIDEWIIKVDKKNKLFVLDLPSGLLEVFI